MYRFSTGLILIVGLTAGVPPAVAQQAAPSLTYWHTAGVGLSTPLGFNAGASYSLVVHGPVFVQVQASASKDVYVTKHSVYAAGAALGLLHSSNVALTALSTGPTYIRGIRGADLSAPFARYESAAMTLTAQVLFKEIHMGFELYTTINPVRNVSGLRLLYRLGNVR